MDRRAAVGLSTGRSVHPDRALKEKIILGVSAEWHVARARSAVRQAMEGTAFSCVSAAYVVTAVSELATNLFFHAANGGTITLSFDFCDGRSGITVVAEDDGPGIPDLELALLDGFTTNGGLGGGLPGIRRLMDEFEIKSRPGAGTQVICRKWIPCR